MNKAKRDQVLSQIRVLQEQISSMPAEQFAEKFYSKSVEDEKAQYYRFMETAVIGCESEIQMKLFEIGKIYLTETGAWAVQWTGIRAEQGGIGFGPTNLQSDDLESLLDVVGRNMTQCKSRYLEKVKRRLEGE